MTKYLNRNALCVKPLSERVNKLVYSRDLVCPHSYPVELTPEAQEDVEKTAEEICRAKERNAARILAFGAHSIKNGLGPVLSQLMQGHWLTHFATNGAGVIHDWEFAFQGQSGEDVHRYTTEGQFGIWQETGTYINLAIISGAFRGLGYGQSIGMMIDLEGIEIPTDEELRERIAAGCQTNASEDSLETASAAADFLKMKKHFSLSDGFLSIPHHKKENSAAYAAWRDGIPYTCHPMIGHDIIYTHPMNKCSAIGRAAELDFLSYADSVSQLEGGVYLSVGSAVMSPMIFEKSLSMARNLSQQEEKKLTDFSIHVVDLAKSAWDWTKEGEPPMDNPAYYLRFCKTFSRMESRKMTYCSADNRSWLVALLKILQKRA
ncbi:MAG: hypothetical protein Q4C95_09660 [Planctomycetia bacterium]|nr:hypothetical protein [Planctomycetia bacterium]